MKHYKIILATIALLAFVGIGSTKIQHQAQELQVKKLEIKSKQGELIKLNNMYEQVLQDKAQTEQEKQQQLEKIKQLEQDKQKLEADLQAKRDQQQAEKQRLAVTPVAQAATGGRAEWLLKLRMCESGGIYATNTGNGFYGAYQFMISTWNNIASKTGRQHLVGVRPDLASPADQDAMIVDNTNMTMGLVTQNPGCYAKMGLSNKPPI